MDLDPEVIGAFGAVIVALTGLIGAVTALWVSLKRNTATTNATHDLVNHLADEKIVRVDQLTDALIERGMAVPEDPAIDAAAKRIHEDLR